MTGSGPAWHQEGYGAVIATLALERIEDQRAGYLGEAVLGQRGTVAAAPRSPAAAAATQSEWKSIIRC